MSSVGKRLAFQDSVLVDVGWRRRAGMALFRPGSFEPAADRPSGDPEVDEVSVELQPHSGAPGSSSQPGTGERGGPSVEDADVIVAGGMGLGAAENFALAEELAGVLGGVVGATRAAVYAGWYPRSGQIGQTGKTVSPKLYVALGISGAVQHKVGMQSSKVIVAINKDPAAPIFEFSDLAVVGDVHDHRPAADRAAARAQGRLTVRPADYPPPFRADEFVAGPTDPADERIEVGVLIVGAGPAGLACAIRFGQLLEEHPEVAEQLGEVPLAVLDKGKQAGSHLLSGAVLNPRGLRQLFGDGFGIEQIPNYGPVPGESVYVMTRQKALPIPTPPTMRNKGNLIISLVAAGPMVGARGPRRAGR